MADQHPGPEAPPTDPVTTSEPAAERPDGADRGDLHVRRRVLTRIAEHTAQLVPGAVEHTSGLGRLAGHRYPSATATVTGTTSRLDLDIEAVWPCNVAELSRAVRDRVRAETGRLCGTRVTSVDVTVHLIEQADTPAARRVE